MKDTRNRVALFVVVFVLSLPTPIFADDPLGAFPTEEAPAEERVKELDDSERERVSMPKDASQIVFSISTVPEATRDAAIEVEAWLRVFGDGQIDARSESRPEIPYCKGQLTEAELAWLLHLAINECQILQRNSKSVQAAIAKQLGNDAEPAQKGPAARVLTNRYRYELNVPAGQNVLLIPQRVLVVRPLRNRLELNAFASLYKYAGFLVARTCLGDEAERQAVLEAINAQTQMEDARFPSFKIEHLQASGALAGNTTAVFFQEVSLGGNRYRDITGVYVQRDGAAKPEIRVHSKLYTKY